MNRQPSNHMVKVLDLTAFQKRAIKLLKPHVEWKKGDTLVTAYTYGVVEKNGKHYLLCNEGVGSVIALEDKPSEVYWYREFRGADNKVHSFGVYPSVQSNLNYDELMSEAKIIDELPLDKFIRVFGTRLEQNYEMWENFLTTKE